MSGPSRTLRTAIALGCASAACTAILDTGVEQCSGDRDCEARAFAATRCVQNVCVTPAAVVDAAMDADADAPPADPTWGCLGSVKWAQQDVSQRVNLRQRFVRFLGESGIGQMDVKACGRLDPECLVPLGSGTTDAEGYLNISVPKGFEGFLSLAPPPTFPAMVPSLVNVVPPPEKDMALDATIPSTLAVHLTSNGELSFLVAQVGSALDPALGHILGIVVDCQGNPAPGVSLHLAVRDKKTIGYYTDTTGTPSTTVTETAPRGEAGFINVPTGVVSLDTTVTALRRKGGQYTVIVRAGSITYLPMSPAP